MKSKKYKYILNARKVNTKNFKSIGWKVSYSAAKAYAEKLIESNSYDEIKISRSTLVKVIKKEVWISNSQIN